MKKTTTKKTSVRRKLVALKAKVKRDVKRIAKSAKTDSAKRRAKARAKAARARKSVFSFWAE